mmetsp:Transcript_41408/g.95986  ORF Transcript_41408/g.95986 Transcript_41408/m.95986 type:complete len:223 (+) Transcript_41408:477-1145(+)
MAEAGAEDCLAPCLCQQLPLHANEVLGWNLESQDLRVLHRAHLHALHDSALLVELLHHSTLQFAWHLDCCFLERLLLAASNRILAVQNLWSADHDLIAFPPHVLHEDAELQRAAALNHEALCGAAHLHAQGQVRKAFLLQPFLNRICCDVLRTRSLASQRRSVHSELHDHSRFFHHYGWHWPRILRVNHSISDGSSSHAGESADVTGEHLVDLNPLVVAELP